MISRIGILTRRDDMSSEQFCDYWRNGHGPLAAKLPGLRRYLQNRVVDSTQLAIDHARGDWNVAGFSQLYFDDTSAMNRAVASAEFLPTVPDVRRFCSDVKVVVCQPNVVVPVADQPEPLIKRMSILTRRPDISPQRFRDEWIGFHAEAVGKFPNLMGYTQNLVIERIGSDLTKPATHDQIPVDGIVELWFRTVEDIRAAFASSAAGRSQRHALDFIGTITTYLVEAQVIV